MSCQKNPVSIAAARLRGERPPYKRRMAGRLISRRIILAGVVSGVPLALPCMLPRATPRPRRPWRSDTHEFMPAYGDRVVADRHCGFLGRYLPLT
jgi:hypothetical protein